MMCILIGHRGVGKSSLVGRIRQMHDHFEKRGIFLDLDRQIELKLGVSVGEIFEQKGEPFFRRLENELFEDLVRQHQGAREDVYISVGAGFQGEIPSPARTVWVRRPTDSRGRIFFDRPRLKSSASAYDEFLALYLERHEKYRARASDELILGEGFDRVNESEALFFGLKPGKLHGFITLMPSALQTPERATEYLMRRLNWGLDGFELRNDLLTPAQMEWVCHLVPSRQLLFSHRDDRKFASISKLAHQSRLDWPLESKKKFPFRPWISSLHRRLRGETVAESGRRLKSKGRGEILKLAIPVRDFQELREGHEWYLKDPAHRSFLPMSEDGRWNWYRLLHKNKMPVQFFREGEGSALDQPIFFDWARWPKAALGAAAVVGDPVDHSWTPADQEFFFAERDMGTFAVRLPENEWSDEVLDFLKDLGIKALAVTSPLKKLAYESCDVTSPVAQGLESVNTMVANEHGWQGTNTDIDGFRALMEDIQGTVAIWGGGGVKTVLRELVPRAVFFSARSEKTEESLSKGWAPETVVWAVGRSRHRGFPDSKWRPKVVVDLNYGEDSPGREYALLTRARYISGEIMFRAQAEAQRKFWGDTGL